MAGGRTTRHPNILRSFICSSLLSLSACADATDLCADAGGVALQILGSGGPIADDGRASTAYIIWADGRSKILIDATLPAGVHEVVWDGRDEQGRAVSEGVYFHRLQLGGERVARRLILLR